MKAFKRILRVEIVDSWAEWFKHALKIFPLLIVVHFALTHAMLSQGYRVVDLMAYFFGVIIFSFSSLCVILLHEGMHYMGIKRFNAHYELMICKLWKIPISIGFRIMPLNRWQNFIISILPYPVALICSAFFYFPLVTGNPFFDAYLLFIGLWSSMTIANVPFDFGILEWISSVLSKSRDIFFYYHST